jgi:hypothetical protein
MTLSEQILEVMRVEKTSSQNPIPASVIANNVDLLDGTVERELEKMYQSTPRSVNRAEITRQGQKWFAYWPTGVVSQFSYGRTLDIKIPPPRRDEINLIKTFTGDTAMQISTAEIKPISQPESIVDTVETKQNMELTILEFIKLKPGCSGKEIRAATGCKTLNSYVAWYLREKYIDVKEVHRKLHLYTFAEKATTHTALSLYELKKRLVKMWQTENGKKNFKSKAEQVILDSHQSVGFNNSPVTTTESDTAPAAYIESPEKTPFDDEYLIAACIETILDLTPPGCHITLRHPAHENIQVEIDGEILANPITVNLEKVSNVFGAIKTLQLDAEMI